MDEEPILRRNGDLSGLLAGEPLDAFSWHELDARIGRLEAEIARVRAHCDKVARDRRLADALFGAPPSAGIAK